MSVLKLPDSGRWRSRGSATGRSLLPTVLVLGAAVLLSLVSWLVPSGIAVARADNTSGSQKIAAFEDVTIGPTEWWDNVVVVGGDLLVLGTVENVVVVVGGDVTIASGARVGTGADPDDAALVSVLGDVTVESGGVISGRTVDVAGGISDAAEIAIADPVLKPWRAGSIVGWVGSTVFMVIVSVIAAAIAPRQVATVRDRMRRHFFSSLGWGALGAIVAVPIVTALLIVTIVGIIVAVPWLAVALPAMSLFGLVAVGAMIGRLILGAKEDRRETVMLAAVLGTVVVNVVRWIPVAGAIVLGLLWLVGFGATYVAIWVWLRDRRRQKRASMTEAQEIG